MLPGAEVLTRPVASGARGRWPLRCALAAAGFAATHALTQVGPDVARGLADPVPVLEEPRPRAGPGSTPSRVTPWRVPRR